MPPKPSLQCLSGRKHTSHQNRSSCARKPPTKRRFGSLSGSAFERSKDLSSTALSSGSAYVTQHRPLLGITSPNRGFATRTPNCRSVPDFGRAEGMVCRCEHRRISARCLRCFGGVVSGGRHRLVITLGSLSHDEFDGLNNFCQIPLALSGRQGKTSTVCCQPVAASSRTHAVSSGASVVDRF